MNAAKTSLSEKKLQSSVNQKSPASGSPVTTAFDAGTAELVNASLTSLCNRFKGLPEAVEPTIAGHYEASFIGPWWIRRLAPLSLPLIGLKGWCGKYLVGNGHATNLIRQGRRPPREAIPMQVMTLPSRLDGKQTLSLTYPPGSPFMLRFFIDELRPMGNHCLLGMTTVDLPVLRRLPLPFVLRKPG